MSRARETEQQVLGRQIPDNQQGNKYRGSKNTNKPPKRGK